MVGIYEKSIIMKLKEIIDSGFEKNIKRDSFENFDFAKAKNKWLHFFGKVTGRKEIIVNEEIKKIWINLIKYVYNIDNDLDNLKGLFLCGNTGSGKSDTMKALYSVLKHDKIKFYKNEKACLFAFEYVSAANLIECFSEEGFEGIIWATKINCLYIDDIGNELECNYFGNKICVISHIVERRYEANLFTHFSSNYKIKDLKYSERIISRITEMSNEIVLAGIDFRMLNI